MGLEGKAGEVAGPDARLVPTGLAALAAGVSAATIRKWASRGKIKRFGTPRRALYDLNELMLLIDDEGASR
ncbi:hypothetical protein SAMN06265355_104432 [Actinomadura mexicana]|uniref:MerR HTH family regulatory protein n=1 Tax=Actinomadura mexicana TaxID=134959 RepID=A0A238XJS3_9ACTN|nr:hypothetical protein SAMN06265355_104432 [Actinomadura mexicana]